MCRLRDVTSVAGLARGLAVVLRDTLSAEVVSLLLNEHLSQVADHQTLLGRDARPSVLVRDGAPPGMRTPNPLFQDRIHRLLLDSPRNGRLPGGTTNGDCRSMPIPGGQIGWFDGSRTEVRLSPPPRSTG